MNYEFIKEHVSYCQLTGDFTWLKDSRARKVKGKKAGCLNAGGYICIQIKGVKYSAHRLAFLLVEGSFPPDQVDHINHIKDDNRWVNIRHSTYQQNAKNHPMQKNNNSGVTGVTWDKVKKLWRAEIINNKKNIYLGRRKDKFLAICLRKSAENKYGFHKNHGIGFA